MPCLDISTNINLDEADRDFVSSELTKILSEIIGRPQKLVMILWKESVWLTFEGNKEPAALAQIISMDNINTQMKRSLIVRIGSVLESQLRIPKERFILKIFDAPLKPISRL